MLYQVSRDGVVLDVFFWLMASWYTAREVDALLTELGETVRGRPDARKRQLESALGVRTRAVRRQA